jgi:glucosamine--fructose-6-phosphate aminotransferase (isomerizing)
MCGICGYIGYETSFIYGYLGILKLLNRGYDSVGITTINRDNTFITHKFASDDLELADAKILRNQSSHDGSISILHSRWRTVGAKNDVNSHPHHDFYNKFSLVHNGIIENYIELREMLIENGFSFKSETDTEVIVNLISHFYTTAVSPIDAIRLALSKIEGTYALAILCIDTPDIMYCVRHGSPLLVGFSADNRFMMVSSECYGFDHKIAKYIAIESNDIVSLCKEDGHIIMKSCANTIYIKRKLECAVESVSPAPYPHWTLKEINEQSISCINAIGNGGRILSDTEVKLGGLDRKRDELLSSNNIVFLGCGTSYHAGLLIINFFKMLRRFNSVQIFDGAEFTEADMPLTGKTCYVFMSQSGETKDLHRCLEMINAARTRMPLDLCPTSPARACEIEASDKGNSYHALEKCKGVITVGVINVVDSLIAREVDCGAYLNCGREVAVASTKAFTSQVVVLTLIAVWFSQDMCESLRRTYIEKVKRLHDDIITTIEANTEICKVVSKSLAVCPSLFILGKDTYLSVAKEGALKLKEIGYIHAEGYSSAALKHGPYALLYPGFPVILLNPNDTTFVRNQAIYDELKSRDALVIGISDTDLHDGYDYKLKVPSGGYTEILMTVVLQLIAYYLSIEKGINPDYPRNIAKVLSTD